MSLKESNKKNLMKFLISKIRKVRRKKWRRKK
jgi:hypothetical protein